MYKIVVVSPVSPYTATARTTDAAGIISDMHTLKCVLVSLNVIPGHACLWSLLLGCYVHVQLEG
jgi:hypothetical protein